MSFSVVRFTDGVVLLISGGGLVTAMFAFRTVGNSPLRRPVAALILLFTGLSLNSFLRLVFPNQLNPQVLRSVTYTVLAVFVLVMVYFQVNVDAGLIRRRT